MQGLVETTFAGAQAIRGKAESQKVWRLDSIRHGATRFEAAVGRGLSALCRSREGDGDRAPPDRGARRASRDRRRGRARHGKSQLLHEFRQCVGEEQAFILTGSCSSDGRQTPFLPFIEVVRGSFQVLSGEAESEIGRKLELGLSDCPPPDSHFF